MPDGADAVVQVEDTEFLGAGPSGARRVRINRAAPPGCDIRQVRLPGGPLGDLARRLCNGIRGDERPCLPPTEPGCLPACLPMEPRASRRCGSWHRGRAAAAHPRSARWTACWCAAQIGSDVALGEVVLPAGQYLGPAEVGILATAGAATVQVRAQQP